MRNPNRIVLLAFLVLLCAGCAARPGGGPEGDVLEPLVAPPLARATPALPEAVGLDSLRQLQDHPAVAQRVDHMLGRSRRTLEISLRRSLEFVPMIERELAEVGVPIELAYLPMVESRFLPDAIGRRAVGLWQFTGPTARKFGLKVEGAIDERRDPEKSTRAAALYLRELYDRFGSWALALAAYNAGPGRVGRALRRQPEANFFELADLRLLPPVTRAYVPKVLAISLIGTRPGDYGVTLPGLSEARSVATDRSAPGAG
jgi:membrane-bound lytic murein transglycosylase D